LTHFTRQLLDHRTAKLMSQMKQTDEVYSVKQRRRRSDSSQSFSLAADPLEIIDPLSSSFRDPHTDRLRDNDGSGELMIPPVDEISEGVADGNALPSAAESDNTSVISQPRRAKMMPYARVVYPQQSTTLRMFRLSCCCRCRFTFVRNLFFTSRFLCWIAV